MVFASCSMRTPERQEPRRRRSGLLTQRGRTGVLSAPAELLTSCVPGNVEPEPLYRRIGFRPTGDLDENDEIILVLDLGVRRRSSMR